MFNSYIEAASLSISGEVNEIVKIPSKQQMFTHLTTTDFFLNVWNQLL